MKGIIIAGSARSDGNTRKIAEEMVSSWDSLDLVDLNDHNISYFDYAHANADDDFIPLVEHILNYDLILFVTPVYWYSMSAIMKTFFDRISDLLTIRKDLGRLLRGKTMGSASCGSDDVLDKEFYYPFLQTARYLGMKYSGHLHTYVQDNDIPEDVVAGIREYIHKLKT